MPKYYTDEENVLVLLSLLKQNNIKRVVASPGTTNMPFVCSVQYDSFFEVYSAPDERSAAYLACGLSAETGEPIVLSCTEATASRNYLPGLTEAFYRKLPILAVTSAKQISYVGHLIPQVLDQSVMPIDTAKYSVSLNVIKDKEDLWDCQIKVNTAILELKRSGGGPVHIHLTTNYSGGYEVKSLQQYRQIQRFTQNDSLPELPEGKIAIFIGSGCKVDLNLSNTIDRFCQVRNAVVFCDHTSSYQGKFKLLFSLVCGQESYDYSEYIPDLLIYIGEISGDYYSHEMGKKQVWRVSIDGELRDTFKTLTRVFEMPESVFFSNYSKSSSETKNSYFNKCFEKLEEFRNRIPELPFSNLWIASQTASRIPDNSVIHFAILNSLRSWNFFPLPNTVRGFANVGGFGIDGCVSTLIGSSLSGNKKLHFGVFGDLAFFYDMNSLGNRHVGANLRILIVNNGCGVEFRNYNHRAAAFGDSADNFIAATGHYGNKSKDLIKHFVQDLGFIYISAENKTEYCNALGVFLNPNASEQSICLEVFTNANDESDALKAIRGIEKNLSGSYKQAIKRVIGEKTIRNIKGFIEKA